MKTNTQNLNCRHFAVLGHARAFHLPPCPNWHFSSDLIWDMRRHCHMTVRRPLSTKRKSFEGIILQEVNSPIETEGMKFSWAASSRRTKHDSISSVDSNSSSDSPFPDSPSFSTSKMNSIKKPCGKKRGRRPSKIDLEAKLERSRQSARECRARKKLRYKCLEDMIADKESYVYKLRDELEMVS